MLEGLYTAAAGLSAQQTQLDAIGNDMANVNTDGYKSERIAFEDLLYGDMDLAGSDTTIGAGAAAQTLGRSDTQGALKETGNPLDLAIEGPGYFEVARPGGGVALTRAGSFSLDASGTIVNGEGDRLSPTLKVPAGVGESELSIAADGTVTAGTHGAIGKIELVTVTSPDHLVSLGGNLFEANAQSGSPHAAAQAHLQQGALEQSNVDLGAEMTSLVTTERAFQMDSSAIQNESQMMSIANQLRPA